jgi:hypothetical protein
MAPRAASFAPFCRLIVDHLECPDIFALQFFGIWTILTPVVCFDYPLAPGILEVSHGYLLTYDTSGITLRLIICKDCKLIMAQQTTTKTATTSAQLPKITEWPGAFGIYKYSKQAIMRNINTFIVLIVISTIINLLSNTIGGSKPSLLLFIATVISALLSVVISIALLVVYLAGISNKQISVSEALNGISKYFVNYVVASIVAGAAALASFILFIIPAFFVIPRLVFTPFLVIDKNLGALDAVQTSWNMSKGHVGKVYGILGATIAMSLLALTIIGIPFAIYFVFMYGAATAVLYNFVSTNK